MLQISNILFIINKKYNIENDTIFEEKKDAIIK